MPKIFRTKANCQAVRRMRYEERLPVKTIAEKLHVWPKAVREALTKGPIKIKEPRK